MTAKLTEGPWKLRKGNNDSHWLIVAGDYANDGEPDLHATILTANPADARAMAESPKLLAALTEIATSVVTYENCDAGEFQEIARAAIAKVTGGAQ